MEVCFRSCSSLLMGDGCRFQPLIFQVFGPYCPIPPLYKPYIPWEPTTFIFRGYNPYIGGVKPSFCVVLGSKGRWYMLVFSLWELQGTSEVSDSPTSPESPEVSFVLRAPLRKWIPSRVSWSTCLLWRVLAWELCSLGPSVGFFKWKLKKKTSKGIHQLTYYIYITYTRLYHKGPGVLCK